MFALILLFICIFVGKIATLMNSLLREESLDSRYMVFALVCRFYLVSCNFWKLKLSPMHPKCVKWKMHTKFIEQKISEGLTHCTQDQNRIYIIWSYFNILDIILTSNMFGYMSTSIKALKSALLKYDFWFIALIFQTTITFTRT